MGADNALSEMDSWNFSSLRLDPVTLMFSTSLLAAMTAVMSWAAARASVPVRALGMGSWARSMGFLSLACILWFLRDRAPFFLTFVVANGLALVSCGFLLEAFARLSSFSLPRFATALLVLLGMTGVVGHFFWHASGVFTVTSISLAFVVMSVWAKVLVLRRPKLRHQASSWFTLLVLGLLSVAMATRAVLALLGRNAEAYAPTASSSVQVFAIIAAAAFVPATTLGFFSMVYEVLRKQTIEDYKRDSLTGLLTRRAFREAKNHFTAEPDAEYALLMFDFDHFKRVNDTYGHATGDLVLKHAAQLLKSAVRPGDLAGRLGGEEFCVLLPGAGLDAAKAVAERMVQQAATTAVQLPNGVVVHYTASIGYAHRDPNPSSGQPETFEQVFERADKALYTAKRGGRNRAEAAPA